MTVQRPRKKSRLAAPLIVLTVSLLSFVLLTAVAMSNAGRPDGFDASTHHWILTHRSAVLVNLAAVITWLGSTLVVVPLVVAGALLLARGPLVARLKVAVLSVSILATGLVVRLIVAELVARPRPPAADWAAAASGYAFPSGHTTGATLAAILLGWLSMRPGMSRSIRTLIWSATGATAVAVGLTRVCLGVHWPTDVLGGWAFALTWITISVVVIRTTANERRDTTVSGPRNASDVG